MPYSISLQVPPSVAAQITDSLKVIDALFTPFFHNLTAGKRRGLRTMSIGREGYVRLISEIAKAHPNDLSRQDNPDDLVNRLAYDDLLETMRQQAIKIVEKITETQQANSSDIMIDADTYVDALKNGRAKSSALDDIMKEIDAYNKRFGGKTPD